MFSVELVMMEGKVPFIFIVAYLIGAEEPSPEKESRISEFRRALGAEQVLLFYLTR